MATKIATTCATVMPCPRAASAVAAKAKGKAKTVWLNFTMRPNVFTTESTEGAEAGSERVSGSEIRTLSFSSVSVLSVPSVVVLHHNHSYLMLRRRGANPATRM